MTDLPLFRAVWPALSPQPLALTTRAVMNRLSRETSERCIDLSDVLAAWAPVKAGLFTATAALAYAAQMEAKRIDVYGADWAVDAPDFDGVTPESARRTPERWELEASIWDAMVAALAERGVVVNRVRPQPVAP